MFWWAKSLLISAAPSPAGYPCPKPVLDLALSLNSSYVLPCSDPFSSGCPNLGGQGVHISLHLFALPLQICFSGILIAAPDFLLFKFFFPVSPQCHHPTSPCLRGSPETKEGGFHPFPCLKLNSLSITACNPTFSSALHWILVSFLPIPFPIFIPRSYSACPWISSTSLSSWHGLLFIPKLLILTYSLCPPKHCQHFSGFWSNLSVFPTEEGQQQKHGVFVEERSPHPPRRPQQQQVGWTRPQQMHRRHPQTGAAASVSTGATAESVQGAIFQRPVNLPNVGSFSQG